MVANPDLKVIVHYGEDGGVRVYTSEPMVVLHVDEGCPADRVFQQKHRAIPETLLLREGGFTGDATPADLKVAKYAREVEGRWAFDLIKGGAA